MNEVAVNRMREKIAKFEKHLFDVPLEYRLEFETYHHFADGLYAREIVIPEGAVLTGKIHRTEHISIISDGAILVATDQGSRLIRAPFTMVCPKNTKRVGLAIVETRWITIHATKERDLEKLEAELISSDYLQIGKVA